MAIRCDRPGLHDITPEVSNVVASSGIATGLCHVFIRHTSASLVIQENADPSARHDLEKAFEKLAPEHAPGTTHHAEGPDDMPSHIRSALTNTSEMIPVVDGSLGLGTWQGLYLFEHRRGARMRSVIVTVTGDAA
ncbi:MAG TPA: secondary thiamine-phosphate synthase enzyme YjbQ [bacterium]|nr:secondary thiamine-phosphate synthase enzyme YjbQ [bacterium]